MNFRSRCYSGKLKQTYVPKKGALKDSYENWAIYGRINTLDTRFQYQNIYADGDEENRISSEEKERERATK